MEKRIEAVLPHLIQLLGEEHVHSGTEQLSVYSKDYSHHPRQSPWCAVFPKESKDVVELVKICSRHSIPIIPYGQGTSLEGHTTTTLDHGGILVSFSRMNSLLSVSVTDKQVRVQPGLSFQKLNDLLKPYNFYFPLDAGPQASIGGMTSTNASGTKAIRYGTMRENVVSLSVVLPDGSFIANTSSRTKKTSAGYDLTRLFVGSEGTLGIVTEVTLKVYSIPKHQSALLLFFETIEDAVGSVMKLLNESEEFLKSITMCEMMDDLMLKAINLYFKKSFMEKPCLYLEFGSDSLAGFDKISSDIPALFPLALSSTVAKTDAEREQLWKIRKLALFASKSLRPELQLLPSGDENENLQIWTTDVCVPISKLSDSILETKRDLNTSFLKAPIAAHVGDGNYHLFIIIDVSNHKEIEEANRINSKMVKRAQQMGGTCTGEHAVGVGKADYLEGELGEEGVQLMWTIKKALDPNNLMNPGKKTTSHRKVEATTHKTTKTRRSRKYIKQLHHHSD